MGRISARCCGWGDALQGVPYQRSSEAKYENHRSGTHLCPASYDELLRIEAPVDGEGHERVVGAGASGDDDELAARTRAVGHRIRSLLVRNGAAPDFLTRLRVEGVKV